MTETDFNTTTGTGGTAGMQWCGNCGSYHFMTAGGCTFDAKRLCIICGEPVGALSMGGADICPSCDCGNTIKIGKHLYKRIR